MLVLPAAAGGVTLPRNLPGPISVLMSVIRTTGVRGLWLGHTGTFIRETGGTAAWFGTKEYIASLLLARRVRRGGSSFSEEDSSIPSTGSARPIDLLPWESALSGACAGAAFNIALFPADSVKSAMQTAEELRPTMTTTTTGNGTTLPATQSFARTFMAMYRAQGIRGLYAGCGITVARSIPSSAIIFLIYDELKKYFG